MFGFQTETKSAEVIIVKLAVPTLTLYKGHKMERMKMFTCLSTGQMSTCLKHRNGFPLIYKMQVFAFLQGKTEKIVCFVLLLSFVLFVFCYRFIISATEEGKQ